ncbi:MAG: hypothetical protein R2850_01705 [Bacteroidia bacterium]
MKNLFFSLLLSAGFSQAQNAAPGKYWVQFTDKNNSSFDISRPSEFLSEKAIERRNKMNIPVVENDIPVNENYVQEIAHLGARVLNRSKWFNAVTIEADSALFVQIQSLPFVSSGIRVARLKEKQQPSNSCPTS